MTWHRAWYRLRRDAVDVLVIALAVAVEIEVVAKRSDVDFAVLGPCALFFVLPLLFRRRFPLVAPGVSLVAFMLAGTVDPSGLERINSAALAGIAVMIVLGAVRDREGAYLGLALGMTTGVYVQYRFPDTTATDLLGAVIIYGGAWFAGRALATRSEQTRILRAKVAEAEQARAVAAERAAAEERARIAGELHDVVAHSVSVMVVQSSGVRRLLREDQHRERDALLSVEQIGRQAMTEMRRMLGVMRTGEDVHATLSPQPGLRHLDHLIAQVVEAGLPVTLRVEGEQPELPPGVDLSAYRIVQEGLTNALKHAPGSRAEVVIRFLENKVDLEIADDGDELAAPDGLGHGLVGMRERVALYGGTLEAGPREGGGYVLRAELPVEVTHA
ncbi:MAG TPA: histidine kinase [Gaiellaceae bacterium]|jgi:signal transduction histidine kinase